MLIWLSPFVHHYFIPFLLKFDVFWPVILEDIITLQNLKGENLCLFIVILSH